MRQHHRPEVGGVPTAEFASAARGLLARPGSGRRTLRPFRALRFLPGTLLIGALTACGSSSTAPPSEGIATILISPDSISLSTGGSRGLSAQARTQSGASVSPGQFFWSTSDSLVATVSQQGVVAAHSPGVAQIGASAEGTTGFAHVVVILPIASTVVVTPAADTMYASGPGDTVKLSAVSYDAAGNLIPGSTVLWSISSGLASVSGGTVVGTNTNAGSVTVTATSPDSGNASGTASVLVLGHVANTAVSTTSLFLSTSGFGFPDTTRVTATLTDTFNHNVTGQRVVRWTTSNPAGAVVDSHGLVTAVATSEMDVQITATTPDGSTGSVTLLVFP